MKYHGEADDYYANLKGEIAGLSSSIADTYNPLNIYEEDDFTIKDGKLCVYTGGVWVETKIVDKFDQGGDKDVFDFSRFDGKRLNDVFADADALHAAIEAGDFSKIHVGDYWEITLNGTYRDYGQFTAPAGITYYTDINCTTVGGTVPTDTVCDAETETDSASLKVGSATVYVDTHDCLPYFVKNLTNSTIKMEVADINPYWCYSDNGGPLAGKTNHVCFISRDGFGANIKMRPANERWCDEQEESFEVESKTGTFTLSDTTKKIRTVRINGTRKAYSAHYTVSGAAVTLKAAAGAAIGDTLTIMYTDDDVCWNHTAVYKTYNDETYGLAALMNAADAKLFTHLCNMRIYNETMSVAGSWGSAWADRGKLFLPIESEVWGEAIYGHAVANANFRPQLAIFTDGKRREKGTANGGARTNWWVGSFYSASVACNVSYNGYANASLALTAICAPLGFVVI